MHARTTNRRRRRIARVVGFSGTGRCRPGSNRALEARQAIAQLEFVLVFPLLVLMIMAFFMLMSGMVTRVETAVASQYKTFHARYPNSGADIAGGDEVVQIPATNTMKRVFGTYNRGASGEPIMARTESRVPAAILRIFEGWLGTTEVRNFVLFDPWDFRALPFEKHGRLTIDQRAEPFGLSMDDLEAFLAFKGITSISLHDGSVVFEQQRINDSGKTVTSGIQQIERELDELLAERQSLLQAHPVDHDAARAIDDQIEALRQQLAELRDGRSHLDVASKTL